MKHAFKFAFRNIRANKLVYGVSVLAIGLGALCVTLLGLYLRNEWTMDSFHQKINHIYALADRNSKESEWKGAPLRYIDSGHLFKASDYNVKSSTELYRYEAGSLPVRVDSLSDLPETLITDSAFFSVFNFAWLAGNPSQIRTEIASVLLTERYARKHFGTIDVLGKPVEITSTIKLNSIVRGILKNPPSNSSIQFDVLIVYNGTMPIFPLGVSFMLIDESVNQERMLKEIDLIYKKRSINNDGIVGLIPFKGLYNSGKASSNWGNILARTGDKRDLYVVVAVLLILFMVTGVNAYNLQKLTTKKLLKQVSLSKLFGAKPNQQMTIRLVESMFVIVFSWAIGCVLCRLFIPFMKQLIGYDISDFWLPFVVIDLLVVVFLVLITSLIPWIRINRIPILYGLKGHFQTENNALGQKFGLSIQFFLSMVLLFASLVVFFQWHFLTNFDLGWNYDSMVRSRLVPEVVFNYNGTSGAQITELFSNKRKQSLYVNNELDAHSSIQSYSQGESPFQEHIRSEWKLKGLVDYTTANNLIVAPEYEKTLQMEVVEGRFFDRKLDWDRGNRKVVINESARDHWNIHSIDSCTLLEPGYEEFKNTKGLEYQIIGVVKDFRYERLALPVRPLVMTYNDNESMEYLIRFAPGKEQEGLAFLQKLHQRVMPDEPFVYSLLSDEAQALYQKERRLGLLFGILTLVTLLISLSGLFALTYHDCQRRIKEVGIRKVNGSSVFEVVLLLNKQLMFFLILAFVVASATGYLLMHRWLEQFATRITLSWWLFALTGLIAFVVALLTVSGLSWKAATRNPVESLRYE